MAGGYSDDDSYDDRDSYGDTYSRSNNSREYSDDDSYGDSGTTYSKSNDSQEYSDYDSYDNRGTTYSKSNDTQEYSDDDSYDNYEESNAKRGKYSDDDSHALSNYNTSYSGSRNQVSVHQKTYRLNNEDKQSGSYNRFTAKDKTVRDEPFVDRYGNRGYMNEQTKSTTYKSGDKRGYTEYSREEKVKRVDYDQSNYRNNNRAVKSYTKYRKY